MNELTFGIALGQLSRRGGTIVRIGQEWYDIRLEMIPDGPDPGSREDPAITLGNLILLLNADEVQI